MKSHIAEEMENIALDRRVLTKAFADFLFGASMAARPTWSADEETLYHQTAAQIEQEDRFSKYIPSAPTLLMELMDALKSETASFRNIKTIIKADPGLTGQIVRISNSPLYLSRNGEITSIEKAISMLGLNEIMQVVSSVMMRKFFKIDSPRYKVSAAKIWMHCQRSAEACAVQSLGKHEFQAFLLGLIHDIGRISILSCFVAECAGKNIDRIDDYAVLRKLMDEYGAWLSALIAAEWGLSGQFLVTLGEFELLCAGKLTEEQYLHQANETRILNLGSQCSMIYALSQDSRLGSEDGIEVLLANGLSREQIIKIHTRFQLSEASLI